MMMPKRTVEESKVLGRDGVAPILSYRNRQYEGKDAEGEGVEGGACPVSLGISAEMCSVA